MLIVGADLVMPKLFYFSEELRKIGYRYTIYTHDVSDQSRAVAARAGADLIAGPPHRKSLGRMLKDAWTLWTRVRRSEYHHAELFSDYHWLASLIYLMLLRIKRIKVALWCRGELDEWDNFSLGHKLYYHFAVRMANLVVLKEPYMARTLLSAGAYFPEKILEVHNTVVLPCEIRKTQESSCVNILFMNAFVPWRHVPFCITVADELRKMNVDFRMRVVGAKRTSRTLLEEERKVAEEIDRLNLSEAVSLHDFTNNPSEYYLCSDVFLLPSELVFCNYALLEAMSHGLIPIILNVDPDGERIVEDGSCGFALPLIASKWAERIADLRDDRLRGEMSRAARRKIGREFTTQATFASYAHRVGLLSTSLHDPNGQRAC